MCNCSGAVRRLRLPPSLLCCVKAPVQAHVWLVITHTSQTSHSYSHNTATCFVRAVCNACSPPCPTASQRSARYCGHEASALHTRLPVTHNATTRLRPASRKALQRPTQASHAARATGRHVHSRCSCCCDLPSQTIRCVASVYGVMERTQQDRQHSSAHPHDGLGCPASSTQKSPRDSTHLQQGTVIEHMPRDERMGPRTVGTANAYVSNTTRLHAMQNLSGCRGNTQTTQTKSMVGDPPKQTSATRPTVCNDTANKRQPLTTRPIHCRKRRAGSDCLPAAAARSRLWQRCCSSSFCVMP
jgi:hypothetical protein